MAAINFISRQQRTAKSHAVYLRADWSAGSWEKVPWLFCDTATWSLAPAIGTAELSWRYGRGMRQGEQQPAAIARLAGKRRLFVKIVIECHAVDLDVVLPGQSDGSDDLRWYGTIELDGRTREGLLRMADGTFFDCGLQPLAAVGLEHALYRQTVRRAKWMDTDEKERVAERTITFNRPGPDGVAAGNRSQLRGLSSYLFSSDVTVPGGATLSEFWNTRNIVEYLVRHEIPLGAGQKDQLKVRFTPQELDRLPDWDRPVIDPHRQSTGELLNLLMPRSRMLSWRLRVDEDDTEEPPRETIFLEPLSLLGEQVNTDLGHFVASDRRQQLQTKVEAQASPDVAYALKESDLQTIDQARVRGARRTSMLTLSEADGSIDRGWNTTLEALYETAYSGNGGYAALDLAQKQAANADVRGADKLSPVFRRFAIPALWDQKVQDGLGAGPIFAAFPADDTVSNSAGRLVCHSELELCPTLSVKDGFDYTMIAQLSENFSRLPKPTRVSEGPHDRLAALVLFQDPVETTKYVHVEKVGLGAAANLSDVRLNRKWSGQVEIPHQDRGLLLHIQGEPQHAIAFTDFEGVAVDEDVGEWDWRKALFTVCLFDDRHAEGVWPPEDQVEANVVALRRDLVVDAGDAYRQDYLVPGTVTGLNVTTRELIRCAGGGWINDDRGVLTARARQIFEYFSSPRRSLTLQTPLVNSALELGDYIVAFGRQAAAVEVGSVVSQITVAIPDGGGLPTIRYETAFAELDATELLLNRPAGWAAGFDRRGGGRG